MGTFLLVRHAYTGVVDKDQTPETDLNEEGVSQAQRLAERLRNYTIHQVYASPYRRAVSTADIICQNTDSSLIVDERLKEVDLWFDPNAFCNRTPDYYQQAVEVLSAAQERMRDLMNELSQKHVDQTIALICHGNLIRVIFSEALKLEIGSLALLRVDHTAISVLHYEDGKQPLFKLERLNDRCHLGK